MGQSLGVCLLGCGQIAPVHAAAWRREAGVRLWTCDAVAERASQLAAAVGAEGVFSALQQALASPEVQVVDICLPHDQHLEAAVQSAAAGKHLLVEKPLTRTVAEADTLLAAVRRAGVECMVGECFRYAPPVVRACAAIAAGDIGEVFLIQVNTLQRHHPVTFRRDRAITGGGVLIDRGIHFVDVLYQLGGAVRSVAALEARGGITEMEGEDTACLQVRFASGAVGQLAVSWGTWRGRIDAGADRAAGAPPIPWFSVFGSRGTLYDLDGLHLVTESEPSARRLVAGLPDPRLIEVEIADYAAALREGRPAPVPAEVGREDLRIVAAAYRSMETQAVVSLDG